MNVKRKYLRYAWPIVTVLAIPLTYNSCQSGFLGSKGFASAKGASCKVMLGKNGVTKIDLTDTTPEAFSIKKVQLRDDADAPLGAQSKASGPILVKAGSSLGVIVKNQCLQENESTLDNTLFSKSAIESGLLFAQLPSQAYQWTADRDYTDIELEQFAANDPCVVGISWNREYKISALSFSDTATASQVYLPAIRAATAYDGFYNSTGGMNLTGTPVVLAVVDTGVDWQHPDLMGNIWAHSMGIGIDITTVGTGLTDFNPFDISSNGHGTHVAGLMAAVSNNGEGIMGVMPYRAKIMAVKIFKADGANLTTSSDYFYNGIQFAQLNGAHVINLSLGAISSGAASDPLAKSAVEAAIAKGVVVTTVLGNSEGSASGALIDGTTMSSIPAQYSTIPGVLGVGSFDVSSGEKSAFSHYSTVFGEIAAPGAEGPGGGPQSPLGIYSTVARTPSNTSGYGRLAGTSQAGPLVSAAAGLVIGIIKEANGGLGPTPDVVETLLLDSAAKSAALATYFKDGNKLDLTNLLKAVNDFDAATKDTATAGGGGGSPVPDGCTN